MSNYLEHAKKEFLHLGYTPIEDSEDDPNKWIQENLLELLEVFGKQGHSGSSAPYCINMFQKLAKFEPLSGIKCTDDEWGEVSEGETYQNNRLSSVFKEGKDGKPYYLNAIVFKGQSGSCFTSGGVVMPDGSKIRSAQQIKLPFTPKTFYIDVIETEWADKEETVEKSGGGWWTSVVKDVTQLEEVFEYYEKNEAA